MQFSVIRTYAATRFRDTGNVIVSDADWKNYVNSVYGNVVMQLPYGPWNELSTTITIAIGVRSGLLPTDVFRVSAVYNATDSYPLVPLEGRSQVYSEYPQQSETGLPMHYRIFAGSLYVYPLPTASTAFTVEYFKLPADLSADADLPAFPESYHDILVSGAVAMAYLDDGNVALAAEYEKEVANMLMALKQEMGQPRQDRFYEIVDSAY